LAALFFNVFWHNGQDKNAFFDSATSIDDYPVALTFNAPIGIDPVDPNASPNDVNHQWSTTKKFSQFPTTYLTVKTSAGLWLLSGNQGKIGTWARKPEYLNLFLLPHRGSLLTFSLGLICFYLIQRT
jgi:hypothetical protein